MKDKHFKNRLSPTQSFSDGRVLPNFSKCPPSVSKNMLITQKISPKNSRLKDITLSLFPVKL